ncbi:hypothetical protein SEA_BOOSTSEASON_79 [Mycobacterium phage BoostSeason]|uniref:Uncharacterized protein n=3 Tax=Timquatrovirus TaxID=1623306 RepID=A0A0M5M0Z4_9CAUD|nr:hypothetical protein PBI_ZOEJ_79 [Mycobacterium phage ZoeJ]YP_009125554.1 hypothetical protein MILLY_80 [Mycobacterium phage Milly]YP_009195325.1 hypothetical protein SEA_MUFASA_79 [Mycobacterium phage Mufasa]YP_009951166.1 hypothetical protein I5G77_gp80 [Mycobacterium phage Findley]AOZ64416.1 hypothetical protein SEA_MARCOLIUSPRIME_79 [Mycobacterium phage Marcoliusprime]ASR86622.1 hypothetical protein SEA_DISMALFUNK_80 [Mycobacterium phage DismalFunk]AYB69048.1 hypothetical protein SEA_D
MRKWIAGTAVALVVALGAQVAAGVGIVVGLGQVPGDLNDLPEPPD